MLATTTVVAAVAAFSQLLVPVAAVDLWFHSQRFCEGASIGCRSIPSGVCCHNAPRTYQSSRCVASSPSGIQHSAFIPLPNGDQGCGTVASRGSCETRCVTLTNMSGQRWDRPGRRRSDEAGVEGADEEAKSCTESVEPDVMQIDGRTYALNDTAMTQEQRDSLWGYFEERLEAADNENGEVTAALTTIPAEFDAFEVDIE